MIHIIHIQYNQNINNKIDIKHNKHKNIIILEYENKTGYHEGIIDLLNELKKKKIP